MRKNGMLGYNGMSSHQQAVKEADAKRAEEKRQQKEQLLPVADLIKAEIKKLRHENIQQLADLINPDTPSDNIAGIIYGVKFNNDSLAKLQNRINTILRHGEKEQEAGK